MMADKKPRGRRPWLDEIRLGGDGQYAYRGSHMKFGGEEAAFRRFRLTNGVLTACLAVCVAATGCLNVGTLDNTVWVLVPYMLEVVFTAAFAWSAVRLLLQGSVVRSYIFKQTVKRLPVLAVIDALAAILTFGSVVVLSAIEKSFPAPVIIYLLLQAAVCALALLELKVLKRAAWESV